VLRGGSWNNNDRANLLSSNRNHNTPGNRNNNGLPSFLRLCGQASPHMMPLRGRAVRVVLVVVMR
jgi:hypothetical protein